VIRLLPPEFARDHQDPPTARGRVFLEVLAIGSYKWIPVFPEVVCEERPRETLKLRLPHAMVVILSPLTNTVQQEVLYMAGQMK